jgi:ABC-type multidrug transport system ATPase subunit
MPPSLEQLVRRWRGGVAPPALPILQGVAGSAGAGEVLAIMGPSGACVHSCVCVRASDVRPLGAGKTTLLHVLTGRIPNYTGHILVNGRAAAAGQLRQLSVCVMQDDVLMRTLSVRECLRFSARLRLPRTLSTAAKMARVEALIAQLGLAKCADTRVWGLSGGERKRTAIAVELVTDPRLLFLDEPTSGLDSATALAVMQLIARLAREDGRTVVTTIHQPSSELFGLFHRLLLLADGRAAYDGAADAARDHFASLGFPCPLYTNPADHMIKVLSRDADEPPHAYADRLARLWAHAGGGSGKAADPTLPAGRSLNSDDDHLLLLLPPAGATVWDEFAQLTLRALRHFVREAMSLRVRIANAVLLGLMMSLFFFGLENNVVGIKDRFAALFFVTAGQILAPALTLVLTCTPRRTRARAVCVCVCLCTGAVPMERAVFMREQDNRVYRVATYYVAKVASEVPFGVVLALVFSIIVYWMIGFNDSEPARFFVFYLSYVCQTPQHTHTCIHKQTNKHPLRVCAGLTRARGGPVRISCRFARRRLA